MPGSNDDFVSDSTGVLPRAGVDSHGTRFAGLVPVRRNVKCGVCVVWPVGIGGLELIGDVHPTDAGEAKAFNFKVMSVAIVRRVITAPAPCLW